MSDNLKDSLHKQLNTKTSARNSRFNFSGFFFKPAIATMLVSLVAIFAITGCDPRVSESWRPRPVGKPAYYKTDAQQQAAVKSFLAALQYKAILDFAAAVQYQKTLAFAAAVEAARLASLHPSGRCGGDLPPCYVMRRESGGNIHAQNPRSTASGKWQFLDSTWAGYGGYAKARYAPEWVQDNKARLLWAGGRGCSHWSAC